MPRQPTRPTRFPIFFIFLPFQSKCFDPRLVWPGRARRTRAAQPLVVVVVMETVRTITPSEALVEAVIKKDAVRFMGGYSSG